MLDFIENIFNFIIKCIVALIKFVVVIVLVIGVIAWNWDTSDSNSDEWMGFVYPDKANLWNDRDVGTLSTLEECREKSLDALRMIGATHSGSYECGLNCDTSKGKPYICEKTKR
ncbi:hypothetical protein [Vibrio rarus]|uniref:hypothetical protein n=1 Tax=Vibrio rarus TaxID=413403 RepID=UPI0021C3D266|nr:hypothetical protein [Vibrio rarus]